MRLTRDGVAAAQAATSAATQALQRVLAAVPSATLEDALRQLHTVLGAIDDAGHPR